MGAQLTSVFHQAVVVVLTLHSWNMYSISYMEMQTLIAMWKVMLCEVTVEPNEVDDC